MHVNRGIWCCTVVANGVQNCTFLRSKEKYCTS